MVEIKQVEDAIDQLVAAQVPISRDPCRTCPDPCEMGHSDYPRRFDVDLTSEMLGSVKPYHRQIVISTGKIDWEREITDEDGSLAQHLSHVSEHHRRPPLAQPESKAQESNVPGVPGVFNSSYASRLSILNGSHRTVSCDDSKETVLVFPDYKFVKDIERSPEGAESLWSRVLDQGVKRAGRPGGLEMRSWPLPFACIVLLCSHKRRDNRCHIAAPKLQDALAQALEAEGFEVHTQLEDPDGPPLEDIPGTDEEREAELARRLQEVSGFKKALILKNSHVGGHKYSGNVLIYKPQGFGIWYGRVTPHEMPAIVKTTICGGKVLPALLRGGVNLMRSHGRNLLSW